MEITSFPYLFDWARRNVWTAISVVIISALMAGGYAFITGYANKFGESFVSGHYHDFTRSVASYTSINALLSDYLSKYNASRIGVGRFHDSIRDIDNNDLFFVTFENVVTSPGIATGFPQVANLPAGEFAQVLPQLIDGKPVFIKIADMPAGNLRELLQSQGDKAVIFLPIVDISNHLIGMLMSAWINASDVPDQQMITTMQLDMGAVAIRIGAYLSGMP